MDNLGIVLDEQILNHVKSEDTTAPYLIETIVTSRTVGKWNPNFDEDATCDCGHPYYRHFDPYEKNDAVGCKYCSCSVWTEPSKKAGLIPFIIHDDKTIEMQFMISSNDNYGGPDPQIAKGHVDPGDEGSQAAAIREANEELGFRESNIHADCYEPVLIFRGMVKGSEGDYTFSLYAVRVKDKIDFDTPHFETKETVWLTNEQYQKIGRDIQRDKVADAHEYIKRWWGV